LCLHHVNLFLSYDDADADDDDDDDDDDACKATVATVEDRVEYEDPLRGFVSSQPTRAGELRKLPSGVWGKSSSRKTILEQFYAMLRVGVF